MKTRNMVMSILAIAPVVLGTASATSLAAETDATENIESGSVTLFVEDFDLGTTKIGDDFAEQQQSDTLVQIRDKTGGKGYVVSGKMTNYSEINPTLNITMNLSDNGDYAMTSEDMQIIDSLTSGEHDYAGKFTTAWGDNPTVGQKVANMTWTLTPITYRVVQKGMWGTAPVELDEDGILHVYAGTLSSNGGSDFVDNDETIKKSDVYEIVFEDVVKAPSDSNTLFGYKFSNLTKMNAEKLDVSDVTKMNGMFFSASSLTPLDLSNWDTSNVTDMSRMFRLASSLTTLDLSNWDTSNVTNMKEMFSSASSLTTLDVSNWDTSNVTSMNNMFYYASSLTALDVSNWDTSNVTDMSFMFSNASSLTTLDVSNWNTSNVTDMSLMFSSASSLTTLDVSNWDTSNVTHMGSMFQSAKSLTTLDVSNWDTSNVTGTGMNWMFSSASSLTTLDVSNWDTSNVTGMSYMFYNADSLTTLDLSNWDTSNVTDMSDMFRLASSLTTLKLGNRTQLLADCELANGFALENDGTELILPFIPEGLGGTGIAGVYVRSLTKGLD